MEDELLEAAQLIEPFGHSSNLERFPFDFASLCIKLLLQSPVDCQIWTAIQIELLEIPQPSEAVFKESGRLSKTEDLMSRSICAKMARVAERGRTRGGIPSGGDRSCSHHERSRFTRLRSCPNPSESKQMN